VLGPPGQHGRQRHQRGLLPIRRRHRAGHHGPQRRWCWGRPTG
jgi:hypothetical protein